MKFGLLILTLTVSAVMTYSANTTQSAQPAHPTLQIQSPEKCEASYSTFIELSDSEECNDIRYALLSYMELQLFYCPMDSDDTVIAQYNMERIQKCEANNK